MAYIKELGKGKYRAHFSVTVDGKTTRPSKVISAKSIADAKRKATSMEVKMREGEQVLAPFAKKPRFVDLVDKWKATDALSLAQKTKEDWYYKLDTFILPAFGNKLVDEIKPYEIKAYLASLLKDGIRVDGKPGGYSEQTRRHHYAIINRMFNYGIENDITEKNPCNVVKKKDIPKKEDKEAAFYDMKQMEQLLSKLEWEYEKGIDQWDWSPHHYNGKDWTNKPDIVQIEAIKKFVYLMHKIYVRIAFTTTFRRSEMCGLEFKDIDYRNNEIILRRTSHYTKEKGVYTQGRLKNKKTSRTVIMTPKYMEEIKEYEEAMKQVRAIMGNLWVDSDRLFIAVNGGKVSMAGGPINPTTISQWFRRFLKRNGLEHMPLHGLRHSGISLMINMGDSADIISERSGNSPKVIEETYSHIFDDSKKKSASYFDKF